MRITEHQLRRLIREEILRESAHVFTPDQVAFYSAGNLFLAGIAALYAVGKLREVGRDMLDGLSFKLQQAARAAARKEAGSKFAAAIEQLSSDEALITLFKELEDLQKSDERGRSAKISKKSKEITAYIKDKRKDIHFGGGDEQDVRRAVSKRLKGDDDKDDEKLDEARWAKLSGLRETRSAAFPPALGKYVDSLGFWVVKSAWQNSGGDLDRAVDELEEYMGDLRWDQEQKAARSPS